MIIIPGSVPSKKNSRVIFVRGGRIVNIPNGAFTKWHKESIRFCRGHGCYLSTTFIRITFFLQNRRRRDLTNMAESVMDLLVDAEVLPDDSYNYVPHLEIVFGGIEPEGPRAEVEILGAKH